MKNEKVNFFVRLSAILGIMIFITMIQSKCDKFLGDWCASRVPKSETPFIKEDKRLDSVSKILKKESIRADSAVTKASKNWHTTKRDIPVNIPGCDTAYKTIEKIVSVGDSMRYADSMAIVARDNELMNKDCQIENFKAWLARKDTILADTVKALNKKGRKRFWNGFKLGFIAGNIVNESVEAGVKAAIK